MGRKPKILTQEPLEAPVSDFVEESISVVEPVQETAPAAPILEAKPDLSKLNDRDKMQSLVNLLKRLPEQYCKTLEMTQETVWALARFWPSEEQLSEARQRIENESRGITN